MNHNSYLPESSMPVCPITAEKLKTAERTGAVLSSVAVLCDRGLDLAVRLGDRIGIIPHDECVFEPTGENIKDIAIISRVGKPVCFKVIDADAETPILSRRLAQKECFETYLSRLIPGDVISARVTRLESFGAFCDIGCGTAALMPVDRMSVSRIAHPRDRFYQGQSIKAVVRTNENGRISLSHKELLGTWLENASRFEAGQTAAGIIRAIEPYGIFIELAPNLAGLAELCDGVCVGETAAVHIKSIIPQKMKIKLTVIDSFAAERTATEYKYPDTDRIDYWRYSPACCERIIDTVFDGSERQ